jgi:DNA-binding IscR family transcriptional regulator
MSGHLTPVTSEALGEHIGANPVVVRRTMAGLRKAGLVSSNKGHGGGWSISQDLKEISLLDIYRALDEPILVQQHRGIEMPECLVEQTVGRALNATFQEAEALIIKRFEKIKLSDLSAEFHARLVERSGRHGRRSSHPSLVMLEL